MRQLNFLALKPRGLANFWPGWLLLTILTFALPQTSPANEYQIFSYSFEQPAIRQQADRSRVVMPGLSSRGDPGQPILPVKSVSILLPPGHSVVEIEVAAQASETLPGVFVVTHGQKQFPLSRPEDWRPTLRSEEIYSSFHSFPAHPYHQAGSWSLCGYNIAVINLYPVSYIPAAGTISYYPQMELRLRTAESPEALARTRQLIRAPEVMTRRISRLVQNPEDINSYRDLAPTPVGLKGALVDTSENYPYVIITDVSLLPAFQPLAEFKTRRGQRSQVITVQDISANYPGQDMPEQIRSFIQDAYTGWGTDFVLLGGDDEIIPHRGLHAEAFGYTDDDIPSDLYFGALDGSWNDDGDQLWGEPGEEDFLPEVIVGRAPVDSPEEVAHFVAKNIQYQLAPVAQQITKALMAGEQLFDNPVTWGGDYKDEIRLGAAANSCTTASFPSQFTVNTLYDRDLGFSWWGGILAGMINDGLHLINHVGHTSVEYALRMTADLVQNNLTNDGVNSSYPIIYSQGCYSASFDNRSPGGLYLDDCVAEALTAGQHGAVAFVGNSRYGWANPGTTDAASQYFDRQFFDALFGEGISLLGSMNDDSRIDNLGRIDDEGMRWCYYEQNLLGDPELDLWTEVPQSMTVLHPDIVTIDEYNAITVVVKSGENRLPGVRVCIRQGNEIYQTNLTDGSGMAYFTLLPTTPDTLEISATAHNYLPYDSTILARADGPSLWYSQHMVDDDINGSSWGNGDGIINQGETIELGLWLKNFGSDVAEKASAELSTDDFYVEILTPVQEFPAIPPDSEKPGKQSYLFSVRGDCPDGHQIDFMLRAYDEAGDQWISVFWVDVSAPRLVCENLVLNDDPPNGNGNGVLEANETALVMLTVRNTGSATARFINGRMSAEGDQYIDVDPIASFFPKIESGNAVNNRWPFYKITASGQSPALHFLDYFLRFSGASEYAGQDTIPHAIGHTGLVEDMEAVTLNWTHQGTRDLWHLSQIRSHSPLHAWHCGSSDGGLYQNGMDASLISKEFPMLSGSELSFWHWYELEEDQDLAHVEINDGQGWIPLGEPFSGASQGWVRATYDLSAYPSGATLQLRLRMTSDEQDCLEGWHIDDVYVGPPRRFVLDQAQVSPERGLETTEFTFSIDYISDLDYAPSSTKVFIDGTPFTLIATDSDYAQGAAFSYQTTLDLGEHDYYFEISSGLYRVRWPKIGALSAPLVTETIYEEDFEAGDGGFTVSGADWEWGQPVSGPGGAYSGAHVWGTVLEGYYSNSSDSRLETPPIDLTDVVLPQLSFWHWYSFDYRKARFDGGNIKISSDGGPFEVIVPENGYEGTISSYNQGIPEEPGFCLYDDGWFWHRETVDLSPYSGHEVVIRFHFGSNSVNNNFYGWYIDDVSVTGLASQPLPATLDISLRLAGEGVQLDWSWPHESEVEEYTIYRGTYENGQFSEPESLASVRSASYTDPSVCTDPIINHYYQVRARGLDGQLSEPSVMVGEFHFPTNRKSAR